MMLANATAEDVQIGGKAPAEMAESQETYL